MRRRKQEGKVEGKIARDAYGLQHMTHNKHTKKKRKIMRNKTRERAKGEEN